MLKYSLSAQLVAHLVNGDWIAKGELTRIVWRHQTGRSAGVPYLPETVGRALRLLEEEGIIAVKPCGISVQYKHIPEGKLRQNYIPSSLRPIGRETILFTTQK